MDLPQTADYRRLFLEDTPLLDVRAPVEFADGAFPAASNLPLVDDAERHAIGIAYKEAGQDSAVALGHRLVDGAVRAARIAAWQEYARRHPNAVLYCFRGGMRSLISQQWLAEAGIRMPRVKGGYKALRRFLLEELVTAAREVRPIVVGGRTGVGKTRLLEQIPGALDLERLAWHRGSAFGRHATPQPTQIAFENALAIALLKHRAAGNPPLVTEDESKHIGARHLPPELYDTLKAAPLLVLEASLEERVENTLSAYIEDSLAEHRALFGRTEGFDHWSEQLLASLDRIRKRLGGARHQELRRLMESAIAQQRRTEDAGLHRGWIAALLAEYYDPMYDYQLAPRQPDPGLSAQPVGADSRRGPVLIRPPCRKRRNPCLRSAWEFNTAIRVPPLRDRAKPHKLRDTAARLQSGRPARHYNHNHTLEIT
ncbi:MAG: tRNA 2-selenouridine synthase [Pseudomonadota bacterium]